MRKIKIGDYFEINKPEGRVLLQYVQKYKTNRELIRVLPESLSFEEDDPDNILDSHEDKFLVIPLRKAYKQGLVNFVGNKGISRSLKLAHQMKSIKFDNNAGLISYQRMDYDLWYKKNKKEQSEDEKKFLLEEQGML